LVKEKENFLVEIKDTGKGINKEEIDFIWNKYYKNEKKHQRNVIGTGLGLSIVKKILEDHNFQCGVASKKGKGTTFYFDYKNEKNHQRNVVGTGLGLSIVKTILEKHQFKYGVKSIKNKGTTFYFFVKKK